MLDVEFSRLVPPAARAKTSLVSRRGQAVILSRWNLRCNVFCQGFLLSREAASWSLPTLSLDNSRSNSVRAILATSSVAPPERDGAVASAMRWRNPATDTPPSKPASSPASRVCRNLSNSDLERTQPMLSSNCCSLKMLTAPSVDSASQRVLKSGSTSDGQWRVHTTSKQCITDATFKQAIIRRIICHSTLRHEDTLPASTCLSSSPASNASLSSG